MKVFISADIEGTAGVTDWNEALKAEPNYPEFRQYMTNELVAACEGARAAGADEVWVKDAHQTGRNLIIGDLPDYVRIIRGWSGHPLLMMQELDESFEAVMFTGYHDKATTDSNPLAHTFTGKARLWLNGEPASEFTFNAYAAAMFGVPIAFLSGDAGICADAKAMVPGIETLAVSQGFGPSTVSMTPARAVTEIRARTEAALTGDRASKYLTLPRQFELVVEFTTPTDAYRSSWYPGAEHLAPCKVRFATESYFEVLRAIRFIVM
ncbi:MAG: M55 family metallopeptidase [Devosia sp.]